MATTALELAKLISDSVAAIDKACATSGTSVPDINAPFNPREEAFRTQPGVRDAVDTAVAAAYQLIATLRLAPHSTLFMTGSFMPVAAIQVAFEANVATIIREAGNNGVHVNEVAAKANIDSKKLVRLLRFLATHHMFREVEPDVFANTRLSSVLDTGKSLAELQSNPINKFDGSHGLQALISRLLDDSFKCSPYAWDQLHDPATAFSEEPEDAIWNRYIGQRKTYWDWVEEPEQAAKLAATGVAMRAMQSAVPTELKGFDFKALTAKDLIVDVGGGLGSVVLPIARANTSVRIIIQDREAVTKDAREHWSRDLPEAVDSGRVTFQPHHFFGPQPVKNASVFLMRHILHDWSDKYASQILSQLRASATPQTKLLVIESIVQYVCPPSAVKEEALVEGARELWKEPPEPLLPNWGVSGIQTYLSDLQMMVMHNGQERTLAHFMRLFEGAGWKIVRVYPDPHDPQIEAVPI